MGYYQINAFKNNGLQFGACWAVILDVARGLKTLGNGGFMDEGAEETPAAKRLREQR